MFLSHLHNFKLKTMKDMNVKLGDWLGVGPSIVAVRVKGEDDGC
jgi:hypothetical protein